MAKAILGTRKALPDGRTRASTAMLFELADFGGRIKDAASADVIPAWEVAGLSADMKVPAEWVAAISAGDAGYVLHTMEQRHGETLASFQTAAWAAYDALVPIEVARRRAQAAGTGEYDTLRFALTR
jgi:hypothetical protein